MATVYKIHPSIGIARVGNSDEFFIGPERRGEYPEPTGGFKDSSCRVKRQAARFRIFAHHDDGSVQEITDAEAEITWTVHLANKKAAHPQRGNSETIADLTIDPGSRSTTGPNQQQLFNTGEIRFSGQAPTKVLLGEMRSDTNNRLLVLGGAGVSASPAGNGIADFWGNVGWYDDISDGPVSASIKLHADNSTPPVLGAWVICAPPKFAPHQDSITTLHDRVLQAMVDAGLATAPTTTSYTQDVYPILQRARDTRWVYETSAHSWPDPVISTGLRNMIFARLRPGGNMPQLNNADSALTPVQLGHMQRWNDNIFTNDWAGVPLPEASVSPSGMDRAALDACVGGAFFPGIEAGGLNSNDRPILNPTNYLEAFRLNHSAVSPGSISASMALPWQADFYACGSNWWPVPRPNRVIAQGTGGYAAWGRDITNYEEMVDNWHALGFVVKQGAQHVEVDRCQTRSITLLTNELNFVDVPQGPMGMVREQSLAITFEVISPMTSVTLEYAPGAPFHPQLVPYNSSVTVGPTSGSNIATARLWIIYKTGVAPSAIPTQTVKVRETVSGKVWNIIIDANTVARKTAAAALVLDRSGSMSDDRGDGQTKHSSLQQAAETFVNVMLEGDGVGLVRYNSDAQVVQEVLPLGTGGLSDFNRSKTIDQIRGSSFDPLGGTSIGDGIHEGRKILDAAGGSFDVKALTVLTDGIENSSLFIADVAGDINERTYAIGLGTPQNTSAAALQNISGNNGGFLLVTGAISGDNRFMLQKYFLQILAGISNAEVVLDPTGRLTRGNVVRIPFQLTDADSGVDVILLSPKVDSIDFRLQTPTGLILEPWRALDEPAMRFVMGDGVSYYRLVLPTQLIADRFDQSGTWYALLTLGQPKMERSPANPQGNDRSLILGLHSNPRQPSQVSSGGIIQNELRRSFAVAQDSQPLAVTNKADKFRFGEEIRALPYSLIVHSYSNISLRVDMRQSNYSPGATIDLRATLTQSGLPLPNAVTWCEMTDPEGSQVRLDFSPTGESSFELTFDTKMAGVYKLRVRSRGRSRLGVTFTREQTMTAVVWRGGDRPIEPGQNVER